MTRPRSHRLPSRRSATSWVFLIEMDDPQELHDIPAWKAHRLTGDRKGTWSLTVTRNWRITFWIDRTEGEVIDLDYEDYH